MKVPFEGLETIFFAVTRLNLEDTCYRYLHYDLHNFESNLAMFGFFLFMVSLRFKLFFHFCPVLPKSGALLQAMTSVQLISRFLVGLFPIYFYEILSILFAHFSFILLWRFLSIQAQKMIGYSTMQLKLDHQAWVLLLRKLFQL